MYLKVVLPEDAQKNGIKDSYINSDKIIETFYNVNEKKYLAIVEMPYVKDNAIVSGVSTYAIEKSDFTKLVKAKKTVLVEKKAQRRLTEHVNCGGIKHVNFKK